MQVLLKEINKSFGNLKAIDNVNLLIEDGEFFTLLGPSGCGKTTLLRIVAGFCKPDTGDIFFGNKKVNNIPPHKRETGMVFQNYALFPHLTVFDNIAYGLKARKVSKQIIYSKIEKILDKVQLKGLEDRYPGQLSGGQQQRVALARALVISPQVLLMDEPLSNLDAKLRVGMREEIKRIQKDLGITTIYVTHDQEEAMAVSDRLAILNFGKIQQIGTPSEIYFKPLNSFVAGFMGSSNLIKVNVIDYDPQKSLLETEVNGNRIYVKSDKISDKELIISLRPEWIKIADNESNKKVNCFSGKVINVTFLGSVLRYKVEAFKNLIITIEIQDPQFYEIKKEGETIFFQFGVDRPVIIES